MLKTLITKLKQISNFPGVISPPETIASPASIFSIHFNLGIIVLIYAIYGDAIIASASACLLAFNFFRHLKSPKPINKILLFALLIVCVLLFLGRFHGETGGQSWMGLLSLLINLKALESSNLRDHYVTLLMVFFLAAVTFAYNNSAITPFILALYSVSVFCSMMLLSNSREIKNSSIVIKNNKKAPLKSTLSSYTAMWKSAGKLLLQALPITIVLFFLFPRIQGDFGFLPDENLDTNPSLSNTMTSGSFSNRSTSNELAFRVEFLQDESGNFPEIKPQDFYWRVKTFSNQKDFEWSLHSVFDQRQSNNVKGSIIDQSSQLNANIISYTITHQPSADVHYPTLETVVSSEFGSLLNNSTIKGKSQQSTFQYQSSSIIKPNNIANTRQLSAHKLSDREYEQFTQTVDIAGTQTENLIKQWLSQVKLGELKNLRTAPNSSQAKQLATMVLQYFREQPFSYHLFPPELEDFEPIEDFLFNTRSGYCEHYASTFSTLMRWMKVPTRVVAGYQGAEFNRLGDFYEVRYSSAHAWSEIWTQDDGWIRVDPTAAVAPERVEFGMDALLALMDENNQESFTSGDFQLNKLRDFISPSGSQGFFRQAKNWFDNANHSWDKWIVNYDFEKQKQLLEKLGIESKNQYLVLTTILFAVLTVFLIAIFLVLRPKNVKKPTVEKFYGLFKKKLNKVGISTPVSIGPENLRQHLLKELPSFENDINRICQFYIETRYNNNDQNLEQFVLAVKRFNPKTS